MNRTQLFKCKLKQDTKTDEIAIIVPLVHLHNDISRLVDDGMGWDGRIRRDEDKRTHHF